MKTNFTKCGSKWIFALQFLLLVSFSFTKTFAGIGITVKGQANGASFAQAETFQWNITGLSNGTTVTNQLWIDLNGNGLVDPVTDLLFVSFLETDGVPGNQGPGDDDGIANGTISTNLPGISFPVAAYIFKTKSGTDSATSTFFVTPMASVTFTISGSVTKNSAGLQNIAVSAQLQSGGEYFALTDANGNYTINTDLPSGTNVSVRIETGSFNSQLTGYIVSPDRLDLSLVSDTSNVNFIISSGKIVMGSVKDTLGNPIADMSVNIYPSTGGNGYNGRTNINGKYLIAVDTGTYTVQFGNDDEPKGYIKTYYNQKYVNWQSNSIHVTASTDTLKNISAVLRKGGLIMGTFIKNGVSIRGSILAFAYNVPGNSLYEVWHDSTQNFYYLFVPPGTYTIQFTPEGNFGGGVFYNQTVSWPGTPVTVNSLSDTAKNINVDFTNIHIPQTYSFIGSGNWSSPSNWMNNLIPPTTLPSGDTIIINSGGQCILDVPQHISSGAILNVFTGSNLVVQGSLTVQ